MMENAENAHGGVGASVSQSSLRGATRMLSAAPSAAGKYPNFVNNGGPVVTSPAIHVSFWGSLWENDAAHTAGSRRLVQFCTDLVASEFMNVLSQYGVGTGNVSGTSTISTVATQLTNASVESTIQTAIDAGTIPEPPRNNRSQVLIVFLDENVDISDQQLGIVMCEPSGDTAFGYHDFFTTKAGNACYYAIIPGLDDACLQRSCPGGDASCSLKLSETQEQRRTQVTSHEFAEMTSDPELNAWYDPQNGENGDICNGQTDTIAVGGNEWTVQRIYSKVDDVATNGATYCLASSPAPKPPA